MSSNILLRAFGNVVSCTRLSGRLKITGKQICRTDRGMAIQNVRTQPSDRMGRLREGGYLFLIVPITTLYLGVWQLKRKKWKENILATLDAGLTMEPVPLPDDIEELKDMNEFTAIYVEGEFDYAHEAYIGPRSDVPDYETHASQRHSGVHVVTPFRLSNRNMTIMINRGWIEAKAWENEERRKAAQVHGHRRVVGVLRKDQEETWFVDTSKPSVKNGLKFFLTRNLERLAAECHTAPVYLDAIELKMQPGAPKGIRIQNDLRNDHLQYAFTWFLVAGVSLSFWIRQFGRPLRPAAIKRSLLKQEAKRNNRRS